jgi:serine/threonine protein kinase
MLRKSCLCINPECPQPNNGGEERFCRACGCGLLFNGKYRAIGLFADGNQDGQLDEKVDATEEDEPENTAIEIYEAIDTTEGDRPKILKVLYTSDRKAIARFHIEADVLMNYWVEGMPPVDSEGFFPFELSIDNPIPAYCLVMDKISGLNLKRWLQRNNYQPIEEIQALDWLQQLTVILGKVHAADFIHCDIKPSNILYRSEDKKLFLIDFGSAYALPAQGSTGDTSTAMGTPAYMAPEQHRGKPNPRSDFYALGRTFVHLLTGRNPETISQDRQNCLLWRQFARPLSDGFAGLIDSLLESNPERRPKDTVQLLSRIQGIKAQQKDNPSRFSRFQLGFMAIVVLSLAILGYFALQQPIDPESDRAPTNSPNTEPCKFRKNGEFNANALALDVREALNLGKVSASYPALQQAANRMEVYGQLGCTVTVRVFREPNQTISPELERELETVVRQAVNPEASDRITIQITPIYPQ